MKKMTIRLLALLLAVMLTGCGGGKVKGAESVSRPDIESEELQFTEPQKGDTIAVIKTSAGEIRAVLYTELAPQTCENFIGLAEQGYYDGMYFSRLEYGFCVESGIAEDGTTSTIWNGSEFAPETTDKLHHYSGALCAPVDSTGNCAGVFYFMETLPDALDEALVTQMTDAGYRQEVIDAYTAGGGAPYLDYTDTVFGQVYSGMDVVDALSQADNLDENGERVEDAPVIESVKIETY